MQDRDFTLEFGEITEGGIAGVSSVNGMTGDVTLGAGDVGAATPSQVATAKSEAIVSANTYTDTRVAQVEADIPTKTSDLTNDSDFQNATQVASAIAPVSTKVDTVDAAINKNVVNSVGITASSSTDTLNLTDGKINIKTGATTSETIPFPVASTTSAGVMNSATYQGLVDVTDIANGLLEGAVAVTGLAAEPTQAQLTTAWETATGRTELMNRAVIYDVTNQKLWTYYTNTSTWYPVTAGGGSVDVQPWTNTQAGIVKGSTQDGQIFAENDGTGSVNGWDTVKSDITNLETGLEGKQDTLTAGDNIDITDNVISAAGDVSFTDLFTDGETQRKIKIGDSASASGNYAVAIGGNTTAAGNTDVVIGANSSTGFGGDCVCIGANTTTSGGNHSTVIGKTAYAQVNYGTAAGYGAHADATHSVAIGDNSSTSSQGEVSFGGSGLGTNGYSGTSYRLLTNVHDPVSDHDAATKGYVDDAVETVEGEIPELLTTTGQSTTAGMTQKAITDALASAGGGGVKTLTTADYNWPVSNPTGVALHLLEPGVYTFNNAAMDVYIVASYPRVYMAANGFAIVGDEYTSGGQSRKNLIVLDGISGQTGIWTIRTNDGGSFSHGKILVEGDIYNYLVSDSTDLALSAAQGKVLKDLIDSLVISGSGAPTTSTVGTVGKLYEDTTNGDLYQCTAVSGSTYTWEQVGGGSGGGDPVYSTVQTSNTATGGAVYIGNKNASQEIVEDPSTSDTHKQYFWALPQGNAATAEPANHTVNILGGKPNTTWGNSENSVYIGYQVSDYANSNGIGIGAYSQPWGQHSIALGSYANTNQNQNSIALGYYAKNTRSGELSLETQYNQGYNGTNYKVIGGVYDGQELHDAATLAQGNTLASTAPTTSTVGVVGQLYTDTSTGKLYHCTAVSGSTYTWSEVGGGGVNVVQTTGQSTTDVMSQKAVTDTIFYNNSTSKIRIGANVDPVGQNAISIGATYCGAQNNITAVGGGINSTMGVGATGVGAECVSTGIGSSAVGYQAKASNHNSVAVGSYSLTSAAGEMNIGTPRSPGNGYNGSDYRLLTGVHDGVNAHDAATYGQIQALEARIAALEGNA